jgi:hypothetical protein
MRSGGNAMSILVAVLGHTENVTHTHTRTLTLSSSETYSLHARLASSVGIRYALGNRASMLRDVMLAVVLVMVLV